MISILISLFIDIDLSGAFFLFTFIYWTGSFIAITSSFHLYIPKKWFTIINSIFSASIAILASDESVHDEKFEFPHRQIVYLMVANKIIVLNENSDTVLIGITSDNILFRSIKARANIIYPKSALISIVEKPNNDGFVFRSK